MVADTRSKRRRTSAAITAPTSPAARITPSWAGSQIEESSA
jgi:hypothetical protein